MRLGKSTKHSNDGNVDSHGKKAGAASKGHGKAFKNGGQMKKYSKAGMNLGTDIGGGKRGSGTGKELGY